MKLYPVDDTIVAAATANAPGAVSVVRLCGPKTLVICAAIARPRKNKAPAEKTAVPQFPPRMAVLADIEDSGGPIDSALVTFFKAPSSFTGEDMAEISCHGSPYITARIISAAMANGARAALPGEFTLRAWRNGKMDLTQAEAVCELISAETASAHKAALNMARGGISKRLAELRAALIDILAQIEVRLDDGDDEQEPFYGKTAMAELGPVITELRALRDSFSVGKLIKQGARAAIVGAPNTGKSSLLNALLGYGRAIVSPAPGTTRDTIEEAVEIGGRKFILVDTAGIRKHAMDPAETEGISRTRAAIGRCDIAIFVLDGSRQSDDCDNAVWRELSSRDGKIVIAVNKSDSGGNYPILLNCENAPETVKISCKTGAGLAELKEALIAACGKEAGENQIVLTSARHYECVRAALSEADCAADIFGRANPPLELAAEHIRLALDAMAAIAGETVSDDVLSVIFGKFCVGK